MAWLFVPESEGWSLGSTSLSETPTAPSVTWRGKPMRPQSWSRAWQKESWVRLLSGTICSLSTADRGVASWISSLRDTRASRFHSPESVMELLTSATSGPTSSPSLSSAGQLSCFSRTSPAICPSALMWSAGTFKKWTIGLRLAYRARLKSGHRTAENDCSSWPTATVKSDGNETENRGVSLPRLSEQWPSPRTNKWGPADSHGKVAQWATPMEADTGRKVTPNGLQSGLIGQAYEFSRPGHKMPKGGEKYQNGSGPRRLNPAFVEWLMGLPPGWTDFAPVGTEWFRWLQRMRSEYLRLSW
jgi:hypothetical protein